MTKSPHNPLRTATPAPSTEGGERIAKVLAHAGVCSRRDAEKLIEQGRVSVDGKVLNTPAVKVLTSQDIRVDDVRVGGPQAVRVWRYHKPDGLVTTHKDPQGRQTVFEALPSGMPRVISVGRLDLTTEGLLLLTTDGGLARALELPSTGWARRYRVRAYGRVSQKQLDRLADGVSVDGIDYGPVKAKLDSQQGGNAWMTVSIREGKNREIRNIMRHLDLQVNRLIRMAYGPFQLGSLKKGALEEVQPKALREQLGRKLSDELGL
ncbi:MAG: pseudouridine synthase [Aquisalinus sp.]|nr:pseudouridine synthase [Aquisalinus sp.]